MRATHHRTCCIRHRRDVGLGNASQVRDIAEWNAPFKHTDHEAGESAPFPRQYHGLFVAFHGSWNRSVPTGYKVVFVPLDDHGNVAGPVRDFATGWLHSTESRTGRPVGLAVGPDGALYVSDDTAGLLYRIAYAG